MATKDKDERSDAPKASTRHTDEAHLLNRLLINAAACRTDDEADALFEFGKAYLDANGMLRVKGTGVCIALADAHLIEEARRRTSGGGAEGPVPEHNDEVGIVDTNPPDAASRSPLDEKEQRTQDASGVKGGPTSVGAASSKDVAADEPPRVPDAAQRSPLDEDPQRTDDYSTSSRRKG